jgi:hypothetical protein
MGRVLRAKALFREAGWEEGSSPVTEEKKRRGGEPGRREGRKKSGIDVFRLKKCTRV